MTKRWAVRASVEGWRTIDGVDRPVRGQLVFVEAETEKEALRKARSVITRRGYAVKTMTAQLRATPERTTT